MPIQTLAANDRLVTATASDGQTVFAVDFDFQDNADVVVETQAAAGGDWTTLTEGVDYTLTGAGGVGDREVTLGSGATEGDKYRIYGATVLSRIASITQKGRFDPVMTDAELVRLLMIAQELVRDLSRTLRAPYGVALTELPAPEEGKVLIWNDEGQMENATSPADGAAAAEASAEESATSASAAADSASAAAGSASAAASSASAASSSATGASDAQSAAEAAQAAAESAQGDAETAQAAAETAQGGAETAQAAAAGSASAAATSATNASNSAGAAATSATGAAGSATAAGSAQSAAEAAQSAAETAQAAAETVYDNFDDRYLGAKASEPTLDNDGDALQEGALYWNSTSKDMWVYDGSAWDPTIPPGEIETSDDVAEGSTNLYLSAAQEAKIDYLTVTGATDLDAIRGRVNELDAAVVLQGEWDASTGSFPGGGTAQAGHSYIVGTGGTVDGVAFAANDRIVAVADNASTSTYAANWLKLDYTDAVLSVAGLTGAVSASGLRSAINVEDGADVTDAANVNAAGAVMNSDTSTAAMGFVIDEDDMASNSATKVPTQQSVRQRIADAVEVTAINAQTGTSYTLVIGDRGQTVTMDNGSANAMIIPTNASVPFPVGTIITGLQLGAGTTSITAASGVTLNGVSAGSGAITDRFAGVSMLKVATDTWVASGAIGTVS